MAVQGSAKGWSLLSRLPELAPAARGSQEAGFTQPRDHLIADPCTCSEIYAYNAFNRCTRASVVPALKAFDSAFMKR